MLHLFSHRSVKREWLKETAINSAWTRMRSKRSRPHADPFPTCSRWVRLIVESWMEGY
jgi:hypothetical protein